MYVCRCILRPENICFWGARSLAHISYNFSVGTFGGLPPSPIPKSWLRYCPSLQKWLPFFFFFFACLSACSAGKWGPFLGEDFFFAVGGGGGGGGGACQLKILVPPTTTQDPPPPLPPYWKNPSYANASKAGRALGFLRRNLRKCSPNIKQLAYISLVRSQLEYASVIMGPTQREPNRPAGKDRKKSCPFCVRKLHPGCQCYNYERTDWSTYPR